MSNAKSAMYENKTILVTGGTGSWGNELTRQLLDNGAGEVRIFSRNELSQVTMQRKFNENRLNFIIGDVRDQESIETAAQGVDYIFHLAALKHVPICEEQPQEAVKTNILGTRNVITAAIKNHVKKVVDVSSDKAVEPLNLYGMTKSVGERLIIQANNMPGDTSFVCIRAGNVLGTNGSVVPYFIDQIKRFNKISITDEKMTRFFLTLPEAIQLIFKAVESSFGGETFVMKMPSCRIIDMAKVLIRKYGNESTEILVTGLRPGEKINEVLLSQYESENAFYYGEDYLLILPTIKIKGLHEHYDHCRFLAKVDFKEYSSGDALMEPSQITTLLKKGRFI